MTGKNALEELKRLEAEGQLDEVLNVDILTTGDIEQFAEPLYDGYDEDEKAALDEVLADRNAVADVAEQTLDDVFPYGETFISCLQDLLNDKVREKLGK